MNIIFPLPGDDETTYPRFTVKLSNFSLQGLYQGLGLSSFLLDKKHEGGNCSDLCLEDFVYAHRPTLSG